MRTSAVLASVSVAASLVHGQVVQWDIAKRKTSIPKLSRRQDGTVTEVIDNDRNKGGYFATCKVGTPGQNLTLQLDTGSSDIWVPSSGSRICSETSQSNGCTLGSCMHTLGIN
jgi:hypothetical protein